MVAPAPLAIAQDHAAPPIRRYSPAETGTDSMIWTTVQGSDGTLYFGGDSLLSFDGERWRQTAINGTIALRGLDFGKDGRLWAAATDEIGWFERLPTGEWTYHSLRPELPADGSALGEYWHVFAEPEGAIFVSAEKIVRWNGKKMQIWPFPGARRLPSIRVSGEIYVHHLPTGLYVMTAAGPRLVIPAAILGQRSVLWMEPFADGFFLATSQGLFTYANGTLTPFAPEVSELVRSGMLTSAARLRDGRLVLGTYQSGLFIVSAHGALERHLTDQDGLRTRSVYSLFLDREDQLWVTTNSIIAQLSVGSATELLGPPSGLLDQPVLKIVRSQGSLTLATDNGILVLQPGKNDFSRIAAFPHRVWNLHPVGDDLLVAGLRGVKRYSGSQATEVHSTNADAYLAQPSRFFPDAFLTSEDRKIVLVGSDGTARDLVLNLQGTATSVAEDKQGTLWMGTSARATLMARPDAHAPVPSVSAGRELGLPDSSGQSIIVGTTDGAILAFVNSGGSIKGPDARGFVPIQDYPERTINAASEVAADGTLWVVHPATEHIAACVARITIKGDHAVWQPHSADTLWRIGAPRCILAETGDSGETILWIGGMAGAMRHVVPRGPVAPAPRPPLLRALAQRAGAEAPQPIAGPLPYSTRSIRFEFAAPEFARRPALHLETMLVGVDDRWMPADATSRRELTALREGRYTFRVRTVAETGVVSQTAVSDFEIIPPWWRTATALVCAVLALVPAGYGTYRLRVRTLRRRNAELEAKVRERTAELAEASAAKTQFIASMSHDIRNPLNGIVGLALALEDTRLTAGQGELVATLRECTTYLSTLVDDVLDFASIEAGRVELRPGPFSPRELLSSIATMLKAEAIAGGATLHVEIDPALPATYVGDEGRIQQILVNYVSNALKYSGGAIRLTAGIPADAREEIEFSVADQGPGISAEDQRILFTKFTRLTNSQSREITGTGLGLASCRLLAGFMGGSVGIDSKAGHGARFYLRLPLETSATPPLETTAATLAHPALVNCTVLVVEDTNYNAMAAAAVLARFGLSCERASTGAEALQLFARNRHQLVLLDRNLPDMDGTEVARRMRAMEADGARTIMLAVTAYCTTEDRALCLNAGMDAFVGKPLTPEKLRRVLLGAGRRHLAAATMLAAPADSPSGVDVSLLEYLSDGTSQGLGGQIELFLIALGEVEKQLEAAAGGGDFKVLGRAAHVALSHARLVGGASLGAAAADLEKAARNRDPRAFDDLFQRVHREIRSLTAIVRHYPGARRPG